MQRYVLYFPGGKPSDDDMCLVRSIEGVQVIQDSEPAAVLVSASGAAIAKLREALPNWTIGKEIEYPKPMPPRYSIKSPKR